MPAQEVVLEVVVPPLPWQVSFTACHANSPLLAPLPLEPWMATDTHMFVHARMCARARGVQVMRECLRIRGYVHACMFAHAYARMYAYA